MARRTGANAKVDPATEPEFDRFASDYEAVLAHHTRIGGEETGYFASYKVEAVRKASGSRGASAGTRILDFGCGVGQSIPYFSRSFPGADLLGTDVSTDSIAIARQRHGSLARFTQCREGQPLPYEDASIDIAFTACVLHHIPAADHPDVLRGIWRVLKPGGRLFVFEHNPLNPITVKIVNACPFDENAVLIRSGVLADRMAAAGFDDLKIRFCLFVPGWLRWLRPLESGLGWCPAGAQYLAIGRKGRAR